MKIANELSLHFVSSRCLFLDVALPMARFVYSSNSCPFCDLTRKKKKISNTYSYHSQISQWLFNSKYKYTQVFLELELSLRWVLESAYLEKVKHVIALPQEVLNFIRGNPVKESVVN